MYVECVQLSFVRGGISIPSRNWDILSHSSSQASQKLSLSKEEKGIPVPHPLHLTRGRTLFSFETRSPHA